MRRIVLIAVLVSVGPGFSGCSGAGGSSKVQAAGFSNQSVAGSYGFRLNDVTFALMEVGVVTADGVGRLSGTVTTNEQGIINNSVPLTGTYSINADGTGSATITALGSTTSFALVVESGGTILDVIENQPGNSDMLYGTMRKQ